MRPLVLCDAAAFCFGPASTLQVVLDELTGSNFRIVLLVSGTTAEFFRDYRECFELVQCDSEDEAELLHHEALFEEAVLFVSNTNPVSALFAIRRNIPTIYLDTLFWMWNEIDPLIARQAIYVAQDFAGTEENVRRVGGQIADFRLVGPLIGVVPRLPRTRTCMISFGGMASKMTVPGKTNNYAQTVTRILLEAFAQLPSFDRYAFRGNGEVMASLASEFTDSRFDFSFVPRARHAEEMAQCQTLLLSPGLTSCYEAIHCETPAWLLPPQNYSQQLQAQYFLTNKRPFFAGKHWAEIYPDTQLRQYLPEATAVAQVAELINRFSVDLDAQSAYRQALVDTLGIWPPTPVADMPLAPGSPRPSRIVADWIRHEIDMRTNV